MTDTIEKTMEEQIEALSNIRFLLLEVKKRDDKLLEENKKLKQMVSYRERLNIDEIQMVIRNAYCYLKELENERLPRETFRCIDDLKENLHKLNRILGV